MQPAVIETLEEISTTWRSEASSEVFQLLSAIKTLAFQVTLHVLQSTHAITLPLSRALQTVNQDLGEALELADAARTVFMTRRHNAVEDFKKIFEAVVAICATYEIPVQKPRFAGKQTHRCSIVTDTVEDFYRISTYIPYLDLFVTHLKDRFLNQRNILCNFAYLFPKRMQNFEEAACTELFKSYETILHDIFPEAGIREVQLWRERIASMDIQNPLEALDICKIDAFPNVHQLLRIMAALPVTTATNERSFSTLRRLKSYLRSTMKEDRLNGLASLNIHRNVNVDINSVLTEFFSVPRRVAMLNGL
ncbi:52 kDa repressor of the inhibitor of the protein kinase-like [Eurosta solidaginis]|uniref:52 kDa repressor of the inhibitor of the protein kinase-like n=1 Tax=Eurosta solidaginis TaxID=178769 RepID=UPI0035307180